MMHRYALYYVPPPGSALAAFGARWLGRDLGDAGASAPPELARAVSAPRRYGFHATLKAPFRLAPGHDERDLVDALERFCRARAPAPVGKLALRVLSDFLVLAPMEFDAGGALARLAADCVREFDPFRAPPTPPEIARRRPERLSPAQAAHLERWGYPWVMGEYRFHLTLTGGLDDAVRGALRAEIARSAGPVLAEPVTVAAICLCGEPAPESEFRILARFDLTGPAGAVANPNTVAPDLPRGDGKGAEPASQARPDSP